MTDWDLRAFARALGAALVGLLVVWLVTAASDEGQLTVGARAGRTLPVAPLCSAVGAAIALGTPRMRGEARALEGLGRSPSQIAIGAALGGALPSALLGLAIATSGAVDVSSFYPRPPRADVFVREDGAFTSPTLGVRVADADPEPLPAALTTPHVRDEGLPGGARASASMATALAGLALALLASQAVLRVSLVGEAGQRRRRVVAAVAGLGCALATLVAFQAAAARSAPPALAIAPSALLLAAMLFGYRSRDEHASRTSG